MRNVPQLAPLPLQLLWTTASDNKRQPRTRLDLLRPKKTKEVVHLNERAQLERRRKAKLQSFTPGDRVLSRNCTKGVKWIPATVVAQTGPVSYTMETSDQLVWKIRLNQLLHTTDRLDGSPEPIVPELVASPEPFPSTEEPLQQPSEMNTVPDRPTLVLTPDNLSPKPGSMASSLQEKVIDLPTGHTYPKRNRRPPDKLSL